LLAACGGAGNIEATPATGEGLSFFSDQEFELLQKIADLMIPKTETPGASDANVAGTIDGLMGAWASQDTQSDIRSALSTLSQSLGGDFMGLNEARSLARLRPVDTAAFRAGAYDHQYDHLKWLIETAYKLSPEGAYEEYRYEPVPGYWDPKFPISEKFK